jgi:incFII family plasmid replication initiator RepA
MSELGLITYTTEYDPQIGCNIPTDMTFTPALFQAGCVRCGRRGRAPESRGGENKQRKTESAAAGDG